MDDNEKQKAPAPVLPRLRPVSQERAREIAEEYTKHRRKSSNKLGKNKKGTRMLSSQVRLKSGMLWFMLYAFAFIASLPYTTSPFVSSQS